MSGFPDQTLTSDQLLEHAGTMRGLARAMLGDRHAAEDVVQDAWVVALTRTPDRADRLGGWLYRVTQNLARMSRRSAARRRSRESGAIRTARTPAPEEVAMRLEVQDRLLAAVRSLEEPYRTTIVLRFFEGLAPVEVAARLGTPVQTVHTRIRRALQMLRARLERDRPEWRAGLVLLAGRHPSFAVGAILMSAKAKIAALVTVVILGAAAVGTSLYLPTAKESGTPDRGDEPPSLVAADAPEERPPAEIAPVAPVETPDPDVPWKIRVEVLKAGGEPAALAYLSFFSAGGAMTGGANADRDGKATIAAIGPGHLVVGGVDGHRPHHVPNLLPPDRGDRFLRVEMEPGLTIRGRVLDHRGVGVKRAHVHTEFVTMPAWLDKNLSVANARADAEGRFELGGLLPGQYRVHAKVYGASRTASDAEPVVAAAGDTDVEIRLGPPIIDFVKLRLLDASSGAPFEGWIELRTVTAAGEKASFWGRIQPEHHVVHARVPLDERTRIRVLAEGYLPAETEEFLLVQDEGTRTADVRLVPDPESLAPVDLVLKDDLGHPIERVILARKAPNADSWFGRDHEAPAGRLALRLPEGTHRLRIQDPAGVFAVSGLITRELDIRVEPGGPREHEVTLLRAGTVDIAYPPDVVTYPSGTVLERTGVFLKTAGGEPLRARSQGKYVAGKRRLVGVPPGEVIVVFKHGDGSHTEKTVRVRPGETTSVTFDE